MRERAGEALSRRGAWALLTTLAALVLAVVPELGEGGWSFRPGQVHPHGILGPLVRAAHRRFDLGFVRTPGMLTGLLLAVVAALGVTRLRRHRSTGFALASVVVVSLLVPAVLLQVGLRRSTAPWFFTNDSTYQIELAGDLILDGDNPYGHDYRNSGLERFYSLNGSVSEGTRTSQVALRHFAYFPGTALAGAAWRLLPGPLDDFRFLVALATLGLGLVALTFPGPLAVRVALGAVLAGNPVAVRAVWFGTADAPSLLLVLGAFALAFRSRWLAAGAAIGGAILFKQFAVVALPFLTVLALRRGAARADLLRAGAASGAVALAGVLPFLIADPGALWDDTIAYGASTYRIVGYGLASLLLRVGVIDDRFGPYPFAWLALLVWAPATAGLLWAQRRASELWKAGAFFAVSIFLLLFLGRVFQTSYLIWPLVGIALAGLIAGAEEDVSSLDEPGASPLVKAPSTSSPLRS